MSMPTPTASQPSTTALTAAGSLRVYALVFTAIVLSATASRLLSFSANESLFWPVTAIALMMVVRRGVLMLLPVAFGILCWALAIAGYPLTTSLFAVASATLPVLLAAQGFKMAQAMFPMPTLMTRLTVLYVCGIGLAASSAALIGTIGRQAGVVEQGQSHLLVWLYYFLIEATSMVIFAPAIVAWLEPEDEPEKPNIEWVSMAMAALLGALSIGLVLQQKAEWIRAVSFLYLPLLAWSAMRASNRAAALASVVIAVLLLSLAAFVQSKVGGDADRLSLASLMLVLFGTTITFQLLHATAVGQRLLSRELARQAVEDWATGLSNDRGFAVALTNHIQQLERNEAVLIEAKILDMDGVSDLVGREHGLTLERAAIGAIEARFKQRPISFARPVAGSFLLLYPVESLQEAQQIAHNCVVAIEGVRFLETARRVSLRATAAGVLLGKTAPRSLDECMSALGYNQGRVLEHGGSQRVLVTHLSSIDLTERVGEIAMLEEVKRAIRDRTFSLVAQPIEPATMAPRTLHYEVLTRLVTSNGVELPPGRFLPLVSRAGLSREFDRVIVSMTLETLARDRVLYTLTTKCAINLTGTTVCDPHFADFYADELRRYGVEAERITLEVTESDAITNMQVAALTLTRLAALGSKISVDDFGTGLATFDYLKHFPVHYLKIDGSFIREIVTKPFDQEVVASVVRVARILGAHTVAEFVCNQEIRAKTASLGVDFLQGYAISEPVPLHELASRAPSRNLTTLKLLRLDEDAQSNKSF